MAAGLLGFACGVVSILAIIESGPKAIAMRHMIPYTDWHTGKAVAKAVPKKSVAFPAGKEPQQDLPTHANDACSAQRDAALCLP